MSENVIIIGGGPAGLSAAIYLARANLTPLLFAGSPPGGQLTLTSEVENYPGYESILGSDLIEKMRNQAKKFGTRIIDQNILKVNFTKKPFEVFLSTSEKDSPTSNYTTKAVIIATGAKALWLNLPSETRLRGHGVSACATCDGFFFREKTVAVIGGGDTALEEALTLTKFANKVYIVHRRDFFRASKIMQDRVLNNKKIEIIWNSVVEEIAGDKKVEGIKLKDKNEKSKTLNLDGVFVAIGHKPDTDLFKDQIEVDKKGYILTTSRIGIENLYRENLSNIENLRLKIPKFDVCYGTQASISGIFAAGDCVDNVYQQASTSVGMGVAASLDVEKYLQQL